MNQFIELPQITLRGVGSEPKDALRKSETVFLARIYGEATAAKTKDAKSGDPYTYLVGAFRAIAPRRNDPAQAVGYFQSERLYLPSTLQERIESQLMLARRNPVKFAYDIFSSPDKEVSSGYRYTFTSLMDAAPTDRVAELGAAIADKAIPAPPAQAAAAPIPAPPAEAAPVAVVDNGKLLVGAPAKKKAGKRK